MTSSRPVSAHPLTLASERVAHALSTLEAAVDYVLLHRNMNAEARESLQNELSQGWQTHVAGLEADLHALEQEKNDLSARNAALASELNSLQQHYIALQQTTSKVANKLDQSISQLDLMLETA